MDNGEVIAVDITYSVYASNQVYYREAFIDAVSASLGIQINTVYITNFQLSSVGTTLIYFDTIIFGNDYDVAAKSAAILSLFNLSSPLCTSISHIGCPAKLVRNMSPLPPLLSAMHAAGLPAAGAYYNDQLVASSFSLVPTPLVVTEVGTWQFLDSNEVIALDIPYISYATQQQYYKEAFISGMAQALGVGLDNVYVNDFQRSAAGTTLIYADIMLPASTSSAILFTFKQVAALFTQCNGSGVSPVGCPAGPNSVLVGALQQFGLPLTEAYYNQQN